MRHTSWNVFVALAAIISLNVISVGSAHAWYCAPGEKISYDEAVQQIAEGRIGVDRQVDTAGHRVTVNVTNNTGCELPVSLASYKLYEPYSPATLSKQEFFEGTPTYTLVASSSQSLSVALPTCSASYVLWYGDVIRVQTDNRVYGEFLSGDQVNMNDLCTRPDAIPAPSPATSTPASSPVATTTTTASSTPSVVDTVAQIYTSSLGSGGSGGQVAAAATANFIPPQPRMASAVQTSFVPSEYIPGAPNTGIGPDDISLFEKILAWFGLQL